MTNSVTINVDRTLGGMDAIRATGLVIGYIDEAVVAAMPLATSYSAEITTAKLGYVAAKDWQAQAKKHGNVLDPHTFLAFLKNLPVEDTESYCTQWTSSNGSFCYVASDVWNGDREVSVNQNDNDWDDSWVVPVRKSSGLEVEP